MSFILRSDIQMYVSFNVQCNPSILLSDVSVVGYQSVKVIESMILSLGTHVRYQVYGFTSGPYGIRWLMLMCLMIKFELGKNIFLFQIEIVTILFKFL